MKFQFKKRYKRIFLNLLLVIIVILCIIFLKSYKGNFNLIKNFNIKYFILLSIFSWITAFVNGWRVKFYTQIFDIRLSFKEWFGLSQVTSMTNYITPFKGGAAVRALYLQKKYKFPYEKFIVTMAATALITFFGYSLLGVFSSLYSLLFSDKFQFNFIIFLIFILILIASIIAFFIPLDFLNRIKQDNFFVRKIKSMIEGWYIIKKNPYNLFMLSIIELSFVIVYSFSLFFGFRAVFVDVPLIYCIIIALISAMSVIFTITPAGLGVKEAVIVWASTTLEQGFIVPLNVAVLIRLVAMLWGIPIGIIFSYILIREEKKALK